MGMCIKCENNNIIEQIYTFDNKLIIELKKVKEKLIKRMKTINKEEKYYYLINNNCVDNILTSHDKEKLNVSYIKSNNINFPINFDIIDDNFLKEMKLELTIEKNIITTIIDYLIIKDNMEQNTFFVCKLIENSYKVEFIFQFKNINSNYTEEINKIINLKEYLKKELNEKIAIYDDNKNQIGFYIYKPNNLDNKIVKIFFYLYYNDKYINNKIKNNSYEKIENVKIVNKQLMDKLKNNYNYLEIINIFKKKEPMFDINNSNFLEQEIKDIFQDSNIDLHIKPSPLSDNFEKHLSELISSNYSEIEIKHSIKIPDKFELIEMEVFQNLIKYVHSSEINRNIFNCCLLGENNIIINNINDPKMLLIYSLKNNNTIEIKYLIQYIDMNILNNELNEICNMKSLSKYLFNKDLELAINDEQKFNVGIFYNFNNEKIGISSYSKPPLIGLANIGATCYMNSTLQCLSNIKQLTNYFLIYHNIFIEDKSFYDMTYEYSNLIENLWGEKNNSKRYYEPYNFKTKIGEKNPLFAGIAANDSKDLILFIFQELHKELNHIENQYNININNELNNINSDQTNEELEYKIFSNDYYKVNNSFIQKLFYGEQATINFCHNCSIKRYNFNIFSFLIFPLEKVREFLVQRNQIFEKVTLKDCFMHWVSDEIMTGTNQMYCNKCNSQSDYTMFNRIYKHPEILTIILNRGKGLEFNVEFEYPEKIVINEFINFGDNPNYENNDDIIEYELISVILHIGESSMAGHFVAVCKSPVDNCWYLYNDAMVSKCEQSPNKNRNNNTTLESIPYVLFYQTTKKPKSKNIFSQNISNQNEEVQQENNNIIEGEKITLYFDFLHKQAYLDVLNDIAFRDVVTNLYNKYELKGEFKFFKKNNVEIDWSKSVKDNLLIDGEHINAIEKNKI